jgi:hypothetical protein
MKFTVKIWDRWNEDEEYAQEIEVESYGDRLKAEDIFLRWAVQSFVERNWADSDYPETTSVRVRTPDGELLEFEVYAEQAVHFRAVLTVLP